MGIIRWPEKDSERALLLALLLAAPAQQGQSHLSHSHLGHSHLSHSDLGHAHSRSSSPHLRQQAATTTMRQHSRFSRDETQRRGPTPLNRRDAGKRGADAGRRPRRRARQRYSGVLKGDRSRVSEARTRRTSTRGRSASAPSCRGRRRPTARRPASETEGTCAGTHGVIQGYSRGTHGYSGVLTGTPGQEGTCAGTHGVLQGTPLKTLACIPYLSSHPH